MRPLRGIKVFSHFFRIGGYLVSRGTPEPSTMQASPQFLAVSEANIFIELFHLRGLLNGVGLDSFKQPASPFPTWEGDGCMKDTNHRIRHRRGHCVDRASGQGTRGCAWRDDQFGRGQNTVLGWSDPTFGHDSVAKNDAWGRSSQHNFLRCVARVRCRVLDEIGE